MMMLYGFIKLRNMDRQAFTCLCQFEPWNSLVSICAIHTCTLRN